MKVSELRDMKELELNKKLKDLKGELFNLRFQHAINQLENPLRLKEVKHDIARVKTILLENELGINQYTEEELKAKKKAEEEKEKKAKAKAKADAKAEAKTKKTKTEEKAEDSKESKEESEEESDEDLTEELVEELEEELEDEKDKK